MQKIRCLYLLLILTPCVAWGQLMQYPLERKINSTPKAAAKMQADTLSLPFWDDFSFTTEDHAVDALWKNNKKVLINNGQAQFAPTKNVATLDGLDENGTPYSTQGLEFGYRDTLESQPIDLSGIPVAQYDSVFFSYFYQAGGYGEPPDPTDFILVEFKGRTPEGEYVWDGADTIRVEPGMDPTLFYESITKVKPAALRYFHDSFQFRFISFGRKSGRYDNWHIDYVYLNAHRSSTDNSFPDRSTFKHLSPLFKDYYAMPYSHFKIDMEENMDLVSFGLINLEDKAQPMNYNLYEKTISYTGGSPSVRNVTVINTQSFSPTLQQYEKRVITMPQTPDFSALATADSLFTQLTLDINTRDNIAADSANFPSAEDINFEINDTLQQSYTLSDYYAYDDGAVDYAAGLTTAGNFLAYRFDTNGAGQDSIINAVFIHFPYFAGPVASTFQFYIFDSQNGEPGEILYDQNVEVVQSGDSEFQKIYLYSGVIVEDTFFLGYREPTTGRVRIGLDKSHDTGDQLYYRDTETSPWIQNDRVYGSLMMRPRFGPGDIVTEVPEIVNDVSIYPNPSASGEFIVKGHASNFHAYTITGQPVELTVSHDGEEAKIKLSAQPGIYLLRYTLQQRVFTGKLMISR